MMNYEEMGLVVACLIIGNGVGGRLKSNRLGMGKNDDVKIRYLHGI